MSKEIKMNKKSGSVGLDEAFKEFKQYSKAKNLSNSTINYYEYNYSRFKKFLKRKNIEYINEVDYKVVQNFTLYLNNNIENGISVNTILRAIRAFLYYCMKLDYIDDFKVEMIKAKKKVKETYSDSELELLLKKPDINDCSFSEYRNWVIINYLLSTGNRVGTVINLKIEDLDFDNGHIHLKTTKNKKEQIIPLSKSMNKILQEYLMYRKGESNSYVFPTIHNNKLTKAGLRTAIKRYNKNRGVNKTSLHLFRHTFAKKWVLAGGDIFRLQKILGHSSMDVVREYVNMFSNDLKNNFDKYNPLEQFTNTGDYIRME